MRAYGLQEAVDRGASGQEVADILGLLNGAGLGGEQTGGPLVRLVR